MIGSTKSRLLVATGLGAAGVVLAPAASFAATTLSVTPSTNLPASSTVTVSGTGYVANGTYKVGTCSKKTYGVFGIPACATGVTVTADASGNLNLGYVAKKVNPNAHASIPVVGAGQPSSFTCKGTAAQDACEIVVTDHNGQSSTIVARQDVTFQ